MGRPKLTEAEKRRRKAQRQADAVNERERRAVGPLFAHLATEYTPAQAAQRSAFVRAEMIEHLHNSPAGPGSRALQWVRLWSIEAHARRLLGERFEPLAAHLRKVFGTSSASYGYGFWRGVLCDGVETVYEYRRRAEGEAGPAVVPSRSARLDPPPMTRAEFHERFPFTEPTHYGEGEPDGQGELFAEVMGRLARRLDT